MSYLDTTRLNFKGWFQADVSTVNNDVRNFDVEHFKAAYQEWAVGNWNPGGTGSFRFIDCKLTGAVLDGRLITPQPGVSAGSDPLFGLSIGNANDRVAGKIVDLDPQQQLVSALWGVQVRIADGDDTLLLGDLDPMGFTCLWKRQIHSVLMDQALAAVWQSVLKVTWPGDVDRHPVLKALRDQCDDDQLSIVLNVYGYGRDPQLPRYTIGHVTGSIGPWRRHEPRHFVAGRWLQAPQTGNPVQTTSGVFSLNAVVQPDGRTLSVDFGNALPIENADSGPTLAPTGPVTVALSLKGATALAAGSTAVVTPGDYTELGTLSETSPAWYAATAGIVDFRLADDETLAASLATTPLVLLGPVGMDGRTRPVLAAEHPQGWRVRADGFVLRLEPGEAADVALRVTRFGKPPVEPVTIGMFPTEGPMGGTGGSPTPRPHVPTPEIAVPADGVAPVAQTLTADCDGRATLQLKADDKGPWLPPTPPANGKPGRPATFTPRGYIDGQLYGFGYRILDGGSTQPLAPPTGTDAYLMDFISVLAFSKCDTTAEPTWEGEIGPMLRQFGNLYPIMSRHLVNLGDYDSVLRHKDILKLAFSLPRTNPNHMPVTRDLSVGKRDRLLAWLDNPLRGTPAPAPVNDAGAPADAPAGPTHRAAGQGLPVGSVGGKSDVIRAQFHSEDEQQ